MLLLEYFQRWEAHHFLRQPDFNEVNNTRLANITAETWPMKELYYPEHLNHCITFWNQRGVVSVTKLLLVESSETQFKLTSI